MKRVYIYPRARQPALGRGVRGSCVSSGHLPRGQWPTREPVAARPTFPQTLRVPLTQSAAVTPVDSRGNLVLSEKGDSPKVHTLRALSFL